MTKIEMTEKIIFAKSQKELSWEAISKEIGLGEVFLTSAALGMNSLTKEYATSFCELLSLDEEVKNTLQLYPKKEWEKTIPNDPLVYRFYEVVGVYGDTLREIIGEKFGDGIMSAIDFSLDVEKQIDPKGDRVVVTLNGKFLPYKSW